jgi:phosphatidylglycerophosphate synthase
MWTPANLVSLFRVGMVPVLLGLAFMGEARIFLWALGASLTSDIIDGQLARRFDQSTEVGAKLDSWGDLLTYAVLPLCAWWLWPAKLFAEAPYIGVALVGFVVPTLYGFAKFRRLTSYHTIGAKLSAIVMGGGLLLWLVFGEPFVFRIACVVAALSGLEEMAITRHLDAWRSDVPSVRHLKRDPLAAS